MSDGRFRNGVGFDCNRPTPSPAPRSTTATGFSSRGGTNLPQPSSMRPHTLLGVSPRIAGAMHRRHPASMVRMVGAPPPHTLHDHNLFVPGHSMPPHPPVPPHHASQGNRQQESHQPRPGMVTPIVLGPAAASPRARRVNQQGEKKKAQATRASIQEKAPPTFSSRPPRWADHEVSSIATFRHCQ